MFIAENIKYLRKKSGYSQNDLADMLGYSSFTTIQKWESGVSTPPLGTFAKMSEFFGVSMDDMAKRDLRQADTGGTMSGSGDYYTLRMSDELIGGKYNDGDIIRLETNASSGKSSVVAAYRRLSICSNQMFLQPIDDTISNEASAFETVSAVQILRRKK